LIHLASLFDVRSEDIFARIMIEITPVKKRGR
jgi:hypothetical protein